MKEIENRVVSYMNSVKNIIKESDISTITMDQCIAIASMIQREDLALRGLDFQALNTIIYQGGFR